eukprot:6125999-Prymnesium_polylepis.1
MFAAQCRTRASAPYGASRRPCRAPTRAASSGPTAPWPENQGAASERAYQRRAPRRAKRSRGSRARCPSQP